jgi:hypothetical protein
MQAIEFETTPMHHTIHVPAGVPDGISMRVLLLWEPNQAPEQNLKNLFASVVEGLSDEDLARPADLGREEASWAI